MEKQIRILQIVDNISRDAGVSSVIMNIFRHIDRTEIIFDFLVCNVAEQRGENYEEEIIKLGGCVTYFGSPLTIKGLFASSIKARNFFKKNANKYDAVHLHTPTIAEFTLKYAKKYGIKTRIVHSHSTILSLNPIKSCINSYLKKRITLYATDYWACSSEAAAFLYGEAFCKTHSIKLVWNAVSYEQFSFDETERQLVRNKLGFNGEKVIIHVSNFSPLKNHLFLIPVIQDVCRAYENVVFMFVGEGPTKKEFELKLDKMGLKEKCYFTGRSKEIRSLMSAADLLILPSIKEGLPVTVIEGQANGLLCLVSDSVTHECDIGRCKFIPLNSKQWSTKIIENLTDYSDLRKQFSRQFQASHFEMINEISEISKFYKEAVKKNSRGDYEEDSVCL